MATQYNEENLLSSMQKSVSNHLGDIQFIKPLNRGSNGYVYLIRTRKEKKLQAVKVIWKGPKVSTNQQKLQKPKTQKAHNIKVRAKNQISIHQSIKSNFVVKFLGQIQDDENFYIILEYCGGGDLSIIMKEKTNGMEMKEVKRIGLEIAKGIDSLHKKGIVHRDIKPQNIVMEKDQIKICDFGCAARLTNQKLSGVVGTLNYMAPQMFRLHDEKVDIWSYGCLLHYLATSKQPFIFKQLKDIPIFFQNHQNFQHYFKVPDSQLESLLVSIFMIDPEQRISFQQIIHHPFFSKDSKQQKQILQIKQANKKKQIIKPNISKQLNVSSLDLKGNKEPMRSNSQQNSSTCHLICQPVFNDPYQQLNDLGKKTLLIKNTKQPEIIKRQNIKRQKDKQNRPLVINRDTISPLNVRGLGKMQMDTSRGKIKIDSYGFVKEAEVKANKNSIQIHISPDGQFITIKKGQGIITQYKLSTLPEKYKGVYKFCKDVVSILKNNNPVVKLEIGGSQYKLMYSGRMIVKTNNKKIEITKNYNFDNSKQMQDMEKYYNLLTKLAEQQII